MIRKEEGKQGYRPLLVVPLLHLRLLLLLLRLLHLRSSSSSRRPPSPPSPLGTLNLPSGTMLLSVSRRFTNLQRLAW
eukprot:4003315-Pyramimonas_sp.AAC.1